MEPTRFRHLLCCNPVCVAIKILEVASYSNLKQLQGSAVQENVFTTKLLSDNVELFLAPRKNIHYYYTSWQKGFKKLKKGGVKFHRGMPDNGALPKWFPQAVVLVMDDLMDEGSNEKRVLDLFTKHSHHQNIMVIYLYRDLFPIGKFAKTISQNAYHVVAFKKLWDRWELITPIASNVMARSS